MAYDQSDMEFYSWPEDATFAATSVTHQIMGPRGKVGFVRDLICEVTTSLVGTTSVPEIMVGISSGDFTFGRYRLGTALTTGYIAGVHRASNELITGNTPRLASDFASHVVLDGGPLTSQGIAGGSYGTVVPSGRIPAGPLTVTNVVLGTAASTDRYFVNGLQASPGSLRVGQKVLVQGVAGVNSTANGILTVAALDTANFAWVELSSQTFSGAYTGGGLITPLIIVTAAANGAGSGTGGGIIRVKIQWVGPETP